MRSDLVIASIIVALCVAAVMLQLGSAAEADPRDGIETLELGEALDPFTVVTYVNRPPLTAHVGRYFGPKATVFMAWSVPCPCVADVEVRLRALRTRFGDDVAWVAVDGEPKDDVETVITHMVRLGAFYPVLLDPQQLLCKRLGFDQATVIAILDDEGRLRYRGGIDSLDDYETGSGAWVDEALTAIVQGESPPSSLRTPEFGCEFDNPASCAQWERP